MIVDKSGKFYAYLSVNKTHTKRANSYLANTLYKHHSEIQKDVTHWHDKIFKK